jgi:hypothetical protein
VLIGDDEYKTFETWMREYIEHHCIIRTLMPGQLDIDRVKDVTTVDHLMPGKSPAVWYPEWFSIQRGLFDPTFLSILSQMFIYKIEREIGHFNFQLSGLETAATPMLASIPLVAKGFGINLNAFVVKKEQKTYGIKNWIEGRPDKNKPVMIIDDLCDSSMSIKRAKLVCEQQEMEVMKDVFVIICKKIPDIKMIYLFNFDNLK